MLWTCGIRYAGATEYSIRLCSICTELLIQCAVQPLPVFKLAPMRSTLILYSFRLNISTITRNFGRKHAHVSHLSSNNLDPGTQMLNFILGAPHHKSQGRCFLVAYCYLSNVWYTIQPVPLRRLKDLSFFSAQRYKRLNQKEYSCCEPKDNKHASDHD